MTTKDRPGELTVIKGGWIVKNKVDYSLYECPYSHLKKECGHQLKGLEGYENVYGVWCECGFRGPVFYLDPDDLKLEKVSNNKPLERSSRSIKRYTGRM